MTSSNANSLKISVQPKPRLYYGYIISLVCFIMMMFGWGIYYSYGVFFVPIEQTFDWSRALTSGALSLSLVISGFLGIVAGRLSDRFGPKIVVIFCAIFLALGYGLMALVQNAWQFYLIYGTLIASGIAGFWSPQISTVARWFQWRRGLMIGIISAGIGFGTLITAPVLTKLIAAYNWRVAYVVIGAAILVVVIVAAQFIRYSPSLKVPLGQRKNEVTRNDPVPGSYSLNQTIRTHQFWMLLTFNFCFGVAQITMMVHIVPYATGTGVSAIGAGGILSVIGGVSLISRIVMGMVTDRLNPKTSMIIGSTIMALSIILLLFSHSLWTLYLFAGLFGFAYGGLSCMLPLIAAELYGLGALGVITAIFGFSFNFGGAIGPVIAGYIFDVNNSYRWAFIVCLLVVLIGLTMVISLKSKKV